MSGRRRSCRTKVSPTPPYTASEERDEIRRLLRELSARERAAIVLRYYCDLSEEETAATLGVAVGTVKSTCARALARLRVESGVT